MAPSLVVVSGRAPLPSPSIIRAPLPACGGQVPRRCWANPLILLNFALEFHCQLRPLHNCIPVFGFLSDTSPNTNLGFNRATGRASLPVQNNKTQPSLHCVANTATKSRTLRPETASLDSRNNKSQCYDIKHDLDDIATLRLAKNATEVNKYSSVKTRRERNMCVLWGKNR